MAAVGLEVLVCRGCVTVAWSRLLAFEAMIDGVERQIIIYCGHLPASWMVDVCFLAAGPEVAPGHVHSRSS